MTATTPEQDTRLPVTLLSGFLGSGKTTLLSYILKSKDHGLRCAVIVNDMGALNIDASLVKNHRLTQKEEKIVQMQNGCICCTLRADLLEEIANLAEKREFDYLIIESSGISEPIQVAETFTSQFADTLADSTVEEIEQSLPEDPTQTVEARSRLAKLISEGGLNKIARLDTCVSVVDSTRFMDDFETVDFLTDRHGVDVAPEDERNITDLIKAPRLTDQIEFANVILLNKTDMMPAETVDRIETVVKTLNPTAKVYRTMYSKTPLSNLINTGLFDFGQAAMGAGWLQSLREESTIQVDDGKGGKKTIPKPETLEYGIGSFVYTARRPFHPARLWELVSRPFCVLQPGAEEEEDDEAEVEEVDDEAWQAEGDVEMKGEASEEEAEEEAESPEAALARMKAEKESMNLPARAEFKKKSDVWSGVLRSKGFCWLATRPGVHGEWSQAGVMFTLGGGGPWMCTVPEAEWPTDDPEVVEAIKTDFMGTWGDRRQELVFIGQNIDQALIKQTLDQVTLNDKEWARWEKVMKSKKSEDKKVERLYDLFDDGWEAWPDHSHSEEHDHDYSHAQSHVVPTNDASIKRSPEKSIKRGEKAVEPEHSKGKAHHHANGREKKARVARAHQ